MAIGAAELSETWSESGSFFGAKAGMALLSP